MLLDSRIELLDKLCRDLKILYLQSNLIPKIGKYIYQNRSSPEVKKETDMLALCFFEEQFKPHR